MRLCSNLTGAGFHSLDPGDDNIDRPSVLVDEDLLSFHESQQIILPDKALHPESKTI